MLNNPEQELNEEIAEDSTGTTEAASEEKEIETESGTTDDSEEELFYQVDGEEISLSEIKKWKAGHMMQSDYTKGKQEVAEKRKQLDEMSTKTNQRLEQLTSLESRLEKLVMADVDETQLNELMEIDPGSYLKEKQKIEARKSQLESIRKEISNAKGELASDASRQLHQQLGWSDQEKYKSDVSAIDSYRKEVGISDERLGSILDPGIMVAFLEAAKYRALKTSNPADSKKVAKISKATRPKAAPPKPLTLAERMYGKQT